MEAVIFILKREPGNRFSQASKASVSTSMRPRYVFLSNTFRNQTYLYGTVLTDAYLYLIFTYKVA